MSPSNDRSLAARAAAAARWGKCEDRTAATQPARNGLRAKFAREIDPDGMLPPHEREYRVDQLVKSHMMRMAIASRKARAQARGAQA